MHLCIRLVPDPKVSKRENARFQAAIGVYDDLDSFLNVAFCTNLFGAVAFATCAHIIAIFSYHVERRSSSCIVGIVVIGYYVITSSIAYMYSDCVLDGIDFDEGLIFREGLEWPPAQDDLEPAPEEEVLLKDGEQAPLGDV